LDIIVSSTRAGRISLTLYRPRSQSPRRTRSTITWTPRASSEGLRLPISACPKMQTP
jgi:hypothetical protein